MTYAGPALGLDVGGSSIKHGQVEIASGRLLAPLASVPTPRPARPEPLVEALCALAQNGVPDMPTGVALPSVIQHGVIHTAANLDPALIGFDAGGALRKRLRRPLALLNDADAAGLAEAHYGAARGVPGAVMMLTFGTGIGSALIVGGRLWPNSELGHMEVDGTEGELRAAARLRTEENLTWPQWAARVNRYLHDINRLFWPDMIVVGGGVLDNWKQFEPLLESRAPVRPAALGAAAGVVGAALAAAQVAM